MKTKKYLKSPLALAKTFFALGLIALFSLAFHYPQNSTEWVVPEAAKKMKNPTTPNDESLMIGKSLYNKHCKSCHGKDGKGDGPKAAELETPTGDFSSAEFQGQTDGAIFYKTSEGRDDMPSFKKKIPLEEDIWFIVNYLRTMK